MRAMLYAAGAAGFVISFLLFAGEVSGQNLFVSCLGNNSIVEISPSGTVSPFASGLNDPADLAFDTSGDLFEADEGSGRIYEFINNDGTLNPNPVLFASGLDEPYGLAMMGGTGLLFVSEYGNGTIADIMPNGTVNSFATGLAGPEGLALGELNVLYVANQQAGGFITAISAGGSKTTVAGGLNSPCGLAVSGLAVFVSSQGGNKIDEIVSKTTETYISGLDDPSGIALYGPTELYEADSGSGNINVFTRIPFPGSGITESTLASGLDEPMGLAFQPLQPAPEPAVLAMLAVGATVLLGYCRKRKRF